MLHDVALLVASLSSPAMLVGLLWSGRRRRTSGQKVARQQCMNRIAWVETDFGRRHVDIVERIEHAALFDLRFEPTRDFEQCRIGVRDTTLRSLSDTELRTMATRLETLYRAAVAHAEHVGLGALRDPKLGTTAIALAGTAANARAPQAEREAASAKLREALRRLGLNIEPEVLDACGLRHELEG